MYNEEEATPICYRGMDNDESEAYSYKWKIQEHCETELEKWYSFPYRVVWDNSYFLVPNHSSSAGWQIILCD